MHYVWLIQDIFDWFFYCFSAKTKMKDNENWGQMPPKKVCNAGVLFIILI